MEVFLKLHRTGVSPDGSTLSGAVKVCGCLPDAGLGRQAHSIAVRLGMAADVIVGSSFVDMYMKCDCVEGARRVFDEMPVRNVVSWTSLLVGYNRNGSPDVAMSIFSDMRRDFVEPNQFTFASVLAAAAAEGDADSGSQLHGLVIKWGHKSAVSVCNSLINMYSKSGYVREAKKIFENMESGNFVTWNGMINGFVLNGYDLEGLELFRLMALARVSLTLPIFITLVKICSNLKALNLAREIHCCVIKNGLELDTNMRMAIIAAYCKCGHTRNAFHLFSKLSGYQNVVTWTVLICGHIQSGQLERAAELFCEMKRVSVWPNNFTYSAILTAFPSVSPSGIHGQVIKTGYQNSLLVGTALMVAYAKNGSTHEASRIFRLLDEKDIVAWSAMLTGYAQVGDFEGAVKLYKSMAKQRVWPNEFTFSGVINACCSPTAAVEQGKQLHASSIKHGFSNAICVGSALVTMYAKRGSIESAHEVFKRLQERDLVSWNSMITGYAQHGYGKKALEIFHAMEGEGIKMDEVTFVGVICACTHAGLVEEGRKYFNSMMLDCQISPSMELYACMVDLYGRAGRLEEAMDLIRGMPFSAGPTVWRTLLSACRVHSNVELGKIAAGHLMSMEPHDSAAYVLLSNIYAAAGNWEAKKRVRKLMEERNVKKETGCSWIELKEKIHSFMAADKSHPLSELIYQKIEGLKIQLKMAGHIPDTTFVLHDVDEERKEDILWKHSERLAIAFGLLATPNGAPLQIVKNLRVCGDCHAVIKVISKIESRVIVVRDPSRFHHFKGGSCSCDDYW